MKSVFGIIELVLLGCDRKDIALCRFIVNKILNIRLRPPIIQTFVCRPVYHCPPVRVCKLL